MFALSRRGQVTSYLPRSPLAGSLQLLKVGYLTVFFKIANHAKNRGQVIFRGLCVSRGMAVGVDTVRVAAARQGLFLAFVASGATRWLFGMWLVAVCRKPGFPCFSVGDILVFSVVFPVFHVM